MKRTIIGIVVATLGLFFVPMYSQSGESRTSSGAVLKVVIEGFNSDEGTVRVALFRSGDGFPSNHKNAVAREAAEIVAGKARVSFAGLPPATYAVGAFHDENRDGVLDKNFLGIPTEGWGASNGAKGTMGPPEFEDASFSFGDTDKVIKITIEY